MTKDEKLMNLITKWDPMHPEKKPIKYIRETNNCLHVSEYAIFGSSDRENDDVQRNCITNAVMILEKNADQKLIENFKDVSDEIGLSCPPRIVFEKKESLYEGDYGTGKGLTNLKTK